MDGSVRCQRLIRASSPNCWNSRLMPVMRVPVAEFINQRQTTPVTMKEIAIGNRNTLRKKFSPLSF